MYEDEDTTVNGNYELPLYLHLGREEQQFILDFLIQRKYKIDEQADLSYPTMRNKMDDDLIEKISKLKKDITISLS